MAYLGSWKIDDALTFPASTHTASTGAATDADAVPDYRVYEDETGTAILTGSMAKLDDASTTGFYSEQITLSAANGFEKGKCYTVYISAAVATITGTMSHTFQMEAEVDANVVSASNVSANIEQVGGASTLPELTAVADAPAAPTLAQALMLLYMWLRNNTQSTSTERRILNDAGAEVLDATMADDGTTFTQGKLTDA